MVAPFLSASWYRVADLRPSMRDNVRVHLHRYRRKLWYILQNDLNGQTHRLSPAAYGCVSMMDGATTLDVIWNRMVERLGDDAPSQDELISLLARLHGAEMLATETTPDSGELFQRHQATKRRRVMELLLNPMSIRLPVWDPDSFLTRTLPLVRWIFTWWGALLWLAVVGRALILVGMHWEELSRGGADRILAADNLALLTLSAIGIKLIHELGHGYAIKAFGGEVHELGLMFLVFFPSPYVDASHSTSFRSKWQRMLVGGAGMLVELFVAALALQCWLLLEPGLARSIAFNTVFVSGVTTLLFNGNPLLRYDGYYILSDLIEIPNLATRANSYWSHLVDRYLFRVEGTPSSGVSRWERGWFLFYAPASFLYRLVLMFRIALYIAGQYLVVGAALAIWTLWTGLALPVWRAVRQIVAGSRYARDRGRVVRFSLAGTALAALVLFVLPFPSHSNSQGVIWLPQEAIVRAGTDGFIAAQAAREGTQVRPGDDLARAIDPELTAHVDALRAQLDELAVRLSIDRDKEDRVDENVTRIQQQQAQAELTREEQRLSELRTASGATGRLAFARSQQLVGSFYRKGDILAFVVPRQSPIVRATVSQDDIGLVRSQLTGVRVLLASDQRRTYDATLIREVPGASGDLPSRALGDQGGGAIATNPTDPERTRALNRQFQVDLQLPSGAPTSAIGSRVYVRFEHNWEPIGLQCYRRIRQLLLSTLYG